MNAFLMTGENAYLIRKSQKLYYKFKITWEFLAKPAEVCARSVTLNSI